MRGIPVAAQRIRLPTLFDYPCPYVRGESMSATLAPPCKKRRRRLSLCIGMYVVPIQQSKCLTRRSPNSLPRIGFHDIIRLPNRNRSEIIDHLGGKGVGDIWVGRLMENHAVAQPACSTPRTAAAADSKAASQSLVGLIVTQQDAAPYIR